MATLPGVPTPQGRTHAPPRPRKPHVVSQPHTHAAIKAGVDVIVNAVRPTLGPLARNVAFEGLRRTDVPAFFDDAATIARRIIAIEPRAHDVGAMLARQAIWRMQRDAGDGAATMAVMYQTLLHEGLRGLAQQGCNAALIRNAWERALPAVIEAIHAGARPLRGRQAIADMALGMCQGDRALADMLGEILDIIGADGLTVVEGSKRLGLDREYVEGTYWKLSGWFSRLFVNQPAEKRVVYEDAALLTTDFALRDPQQLLPVLERCVNAGVKRLMIVAADVSDGVVALLANNSNARVIESAVVRIPKVTEIDRLAALDDLVALAGGRAFCSAAFGTLDTFRPEDLGRARRAWATDSLFGLYGGAGDARKLRQHMQQVRAQLQAAEDAHQKSELQARLGRLSGGTAILRLGAIHETERDARKHVAERAIATLRQALDGGVVDGGGAALLRASHAVCAQHARNDDERLAFAMLARALEAPLRAIAQNAGHAPDVIVERVRAAPDGHGFDARCGGIVNLRAAGIADAAVTLERALRVAVSGAAMALTTDVIVHHRNPAESIEP